MDYFQNSLKIKGSETHLILETLIQFSFSTFRYDGFSPLIIFLLILFEVSNAFHDRIWLNIETKMYQTM